MLQQHFTSEQLRELSSRMDVQHSTGLSYYPLLKPGERFPVNDPHKQPCLTPRPGRSLDFPVAANKHSTSSKFATPCMRFVWQFSLDTQLSWAHLVPCWVLKSYSRHMQQLSLKHSARLRADGLSMGGLQRMTHSSCKACWKASQTSKPRLTSAWLRWGHHR